MKQESSKSALFLMELILAILFFAISGAVCARLFVGAHLVSTATRDENRAIAFAQSAAACVQSQNGDFTTAAALLEGRQQNGIVTVFYDKDGQPVAAEAGSLYTMTLTPDDGEEQAEVTVRRIGRSEPVFSLHIAWHKPLAG
ncbi:MAG: hypothetical protein RSF90_03250 [Pygmaiobacter sp.]